MGPKGGDKGGEIVAEGTPEQVAEEPRSYTGRYLAPLLSGARVDRALPRTRKRGVPQPKCAKGRRPNRNGSGTASLWLRQLAHLPCPAVRLLVQRVWDYVIHHGIHDARMPGVTIMISARRQLDAA